ncbi:beta-galactosidase trimerization domain-containing protein [uncultured Sphaerochaeta sp.]|uniref:beta-galactosidase trimerization domain-containing protein n=1 Tax=uncultured Sphaerochaeta sp. TaxID=886478 RepID=UPI002A0A857C|nr:beta-galactosidase trimerization domain-containing protein [uncultured Sphaerochaeta sp.]
MYTIPFRHIHLDFHTSGLIDGIGKDYSKQEFQQALEDGCVDSITLCAKCHHGWMYYPSMAFEMHPHLRFDLFGDMVAAAKEMGLTVEAYVSVGYDEKIALLHSDYLMRNADQSLDTTSDFLSPGYHQFCLNTPYLDIVCQQVADVLSNYTVDGLFLDIVGERECYCSHCMQEAYAQGLDPRDKKQMGIIWKKTYTEYVRRIKEVVDRVQPGIEIFHNSGHVNRGRSDLMKVNSHLELESLPTGGWGYDHFLLSSRFVQPLGIPFLGMTGRFQYGWGDFGGYKHPNGLRYETARFLANGAGCSIGDQMHPFGKLDLGLYRMIGQVYREVELAQPWCVEVQPISEIGILSTESTGDYVIKGAGDSLLQGSSDIGAVRILEEGHYLFDVIGSQADFTHYTLIILPDRIKGNHDLEKKLQAFVAQGGKVLATGISAIGFEGGAKLDLGVIWMGQDQLLPNYIHPDFSLDPLLSDSYVMYLGCQSILANSDTIKLASVQEPFFKRSLEHFSSHYHTASSLEDGAAGIVKHENGIYCAWSLFAEYAQKANLAAKYVAFHLIDLLLPSRYVVSAYPAQVELSLMHQEKEKRFVFHVINGSLVKHGANMEVVEDFMEVPAMPVKLQLPSSIQKVFLVPQGTELPFEPIAGGVAFTVPPFTCHQMVSLEYGN